MIKYTEEGHRIRMVGCKHYYFFSLQHGRDTCGLVFVFRLTTTWLQENKHSGSKPSIYVIRFRCHVSCYVSYDLNFVFTMFRYLLSP